LVEAWDEAGLNIVEGTMVVVQVGPLLVHVVGAETEGTEDPLEFDDPIEVFEEEEAVVAKVGVLRLEFR
jgi:hypothetical protein